MNYRKRAFLLSVIWLSSYFLLFLGLVGYMLVIESPESTFFAIEYHGIVAVAVLCWFLPLACLIRGAAAKAQIRVLKMISMIGIIFLSFTGMVALIGFVYRLYTGQ